MKKSFLPLIGCFGFLLTSCGLMGNPFGSGGGGDNPFAPKSEPGTSQTGQTWAPTSQQIEYSYSTVNMLTGYAEKAFTELCNRHNDALNNMGNEPVELSPVVSFYEDTGNIWDMRCSYSLYSGPDRFLRLDGFTLSAMPDFEEHYFAYAIEVQISYGGTVYYSDDLPVRVRTVQLVPISKIASYLPGSRLSTSGCVTATYGTSFFLQDGDCAIEVSSNEDFGVSVGDNIFLTGTADTYRSQLRITPDAVRPIDRPFDVLEVSLLEVNDMHDLSYGARKCYGDDLYVKSITAKNSFPFHSIDATFAIGSENGREIPAHFDSRYLSEDDLSTWCDIDSSGALSVSDNKVMPGDRLSLRNGILRFEDDELKIVLGRAEFIERPVVDTETTYSVEFSEAMDKAMNLDASKHTDDFYEFDAYIVRRDNNKYLLSDSPSVLDSVSPSELFHLFYSGGLDMPDFDKGSKIHVSTKLLNYNGTTAQNFGTATVTLLNPGTPWHDNPTHVTVAEAIETARGLPNASTSSICYQVSGIAGSDINTGDFTGNLTLYDSSDRSKSIILLNVHTLGNEIVEGSSVSFRGTLKNVDGNKAQLLYCLWTDEEAVDMEEAIDEAWNSISDNFAGFKDGFIDGTPLPKTAVGKGIEFQLMYGIAEEGNKWFFLGWNGEQFTLCANKDQEEHRGKYLEVSFEYGGVQYRVVLVEVYASPVDE